MAEGSEQIKINSHGSRQFLSLISKKIGASDFHQKSWACLTRLCHASPVQASFPRSFHHHPHHSLAPRFDFLNLHISTLFIISLRTRRWPSSYAVPSRSRRPCDTQQRLLKLRYASSTSRHSNKPHRSHLKHNPSSTAIEMHFS